MEQKLATETELERTNNELNEVRQQMLSTQSQLKDKLCQSEEAICQLEVMKMEVEELQVQLKMEQDQTEELMEQLKLERHQTAELQEKVLALQPGELMSDYCQTDGACELEVEIESLKELQNAAQKELDVERDHSADLKAQLSELQAVEQDVKMEQDQTEVCRLQAEIESLKELQNATQNELDLERCHAADLKSKLSELQAVKQDMKYCETDAMSEDEVCQLRAEIESLKELQNTTQNELDVERDHTADLKSKLSELQDIKHCQTDAVSEDEVCQLRAEMNTAQKELDLERDHTAELKAKLSELQAVEQDVKMEQDQTEVCRLQADIESLKELQNATQNDLDVERDHTADLKAQLSELQAVERDTNHCQTDAMSEDEVCRLQAEIESLKEQLNATQKEQDMVCCDLAEMKEKEPCMVQLETKYTQTCALSEEEDSRPLEDGEQTCDILTTAENELDIVCYYADVDARVTEIDCQTDAKSEQVKCKPRDTEVEEEQSGEMLRTAVLESKYCQTDGDSEEGDEKEQLREQLKKTLDELRSERNEAELLRQQLQCHLSDVDAFQPTLRSKVLTCFVHRWKMKMRAKKHLW